MSDTFKAILVSRDEEKKQSVAITELSEADLMEGDVTVKVEATTVNYKDGLAITGKAPVVRRFPLIPGIDFAGTVISSQHPEWQPGDKVVLNGWGVGETHHGAYAGKARVKGDWLVPLPEGMTARDAMAVGTAGYTAMLSVMALERHGIAPERGPVVVTGAAGGVGSVAVSLLSKLGYHVIASTGRLGESAYLAELGAAEVIGRDELSRAGQAARQGALGGRRRRRRQPHARQRPVDDGLWRRHRRLRPRRRHGPAVERRAIHLARRLPARHRFRDGAARAAAGGLAAHRHRPRPRQARRAVAHDPLRGHHRGRPGHRRRQGARTARRRALSASSKVPAIAKIVAVGRNLP